MASAVVLQIEYGKLPKGTFGWIGEYGTHFWVVPVNKVATIYIKKFPQCGGAGAETGEDFETDVMSCLKS